jgi:Bcr/CflA subfamily drug resistance transporter
LTRPLSDRALLLLLAAVTALGPIATNLYLPALPAVREYFGASVAAVQATFSVSLVTFALGILAWGPISDRYGRRKAVLYGLSIMIVGTIVCLAAQSLQWLIAGRGLQAFGTATGLVTARAIVADLYPAERMAKLFASLTMVAVLGNSLAPVLGGFVATGFGWRAIFAALMFTTLVVGVFAWRRLPETRRAGVHPPRAKEMLATAWSLSRDTLFAGCVAQSAVVYATFLVFISLAPYVMVSALGRPATEFGFYYLFIAVGYFLGNWSVCRLMGRRDGRRRRTGDGRRFERGARLCRTGFEASALDLHTDGRAGFRAGTRAAKRHCDGGEPLARSRGRRLEPDRLPATDDRRDLRTADGPLSDRHADAVADILRVGLRPRTCDVVRVPAGRRARPAGSSAGPAIRRELTGIASNAPLDAGRTLLHMRYRSRALQKRPS